MSFSDTTVIEGGKERKHSWDLKSFILGDTLQLLAPLPRTGMFSKNWRAILVEVAGPKAPHWKNPKPYLSHLSNSTTQCRDIHFLHNIYIYIYYDREFTDRNEICTAYVKSNSKHILFFWEIFDLRYIFRDNYAYNVIHTIIYIYILAPIWGGSGTRSPLIFWDTFPRYLRILFHP